MKNNLFGGANKINMDADYEDDEEYEELDANTNIDINKKLHIDLNNEELVLGDDDIFSGDDKIVLEYRRVNYGRKSITRNFTYKCYGRN